MCMHGQSVFEISPTPQSTTDKINYSNSAHNSTIKTSRKPILFQSDNPEKNPTSNYCMYKHYPISILL